MNIRKNPQSLIIIFATILLLSLSPFACQQEVVQVDTRNLTQLPSIIKPEDELFWYNLRLPEQTILTKEKQNGQNILKLTFPEGIKLVVQHEDKTLSLSSFGCYTCTSECTDGCDVVKLGNEIGCSRCNDTPAKPCTGSDCFSSLSLGYIDTNVGITFIKKTDKSRLKFIDTPNWEILSQIPEVNEAIESLNLKYYGVKNLTKDFENIERKGYLINLFGAPAVYYIPTSYFKNQPQSRVESEYEEIEDGGGDSVKCNCESGTSGCTKEAIKNMGITIGYKCVPGR